MPTFGIIGRKPRTSCPATRASSSPRILAYAIGMSYLDDMRFAWYEDGISARSRASSGDVLDGGSRERHPGDEDHPRRGRPRNLRAPRPARRRGSALERGRDAPCSFRPIPLNRHGPEATMPRWSAGRRAPFTGRGTLLAKAFPECRSQRHSPRCGERPHRAPPGASPPRRRRGNHSLAAGEATSPRVFPRGPAQA